VPKFTHLLGQCKFSFLLLHFLGGAYIFSEDRIEDDDGEEDDDPRYSYRPRPVYLPEIHLPRERDGGQSTSILRGTETDGSPHTSDLEPGSGPQRNAADRRVEVSAEDEEEQTEDFGNKILPG
jgi:hypothetical protein